MNFGLNKVTGTGRQTVEMLKHKTEDLEQKTEDLEKKPMPGYTRIDELDPDEIEHFVREADGAKVYQFKKGNIAFTVEASWLLVTKMGGNVQDPEDDVAILTDKPDDNYLELVVGTVEKVGDFVTVNATGNYDLGIDSGGSCGLFFMMYYLDGGNVENGEPTFYKR